MKRVAICIKGAVGKKDADDVRFCVPGDVYRVGEYIDYVAVRNSIFKHIINVNPDYEFDFFLHGWNLDLSYNLTRIYEPKKHLFEDNTRYDTVITPTIVKSSDFGGVSGSLSIKKSIELKDIYEIEQNIKYDIVIVYRYDILLWADMNLDMYDVTNSIYCNAWNGSCGGDFHFVMSHTNANKFKYLYDSISMYTNKYQYHTWIPNYVSNIIKVNLREDNIYAGKCQEHMRVINNSEKLKTILAGYL